MPLWVSKIPGENIMSRFSRGKILNWYSRSEELIQKLLTKRCLEKPKKAKPMLERYIV